MSDSTPQNALPSSYAFSTKIEDLPDVLPIFPLPHVVLLPGGRLPLNIFEPRYLALVENALKEGRLFGMIQPLHAEDEDETSPELYSIGSVGRIVHFSENDSEQLFIVLLGICRFQVICEDKPDESGYRRARVDYTQFVDDIEDPAGGELAAPRKRLMDCLKRYVTAHDLDIDLRALDALSTPSLVVTLSMALPFEAPEKQALLEAPTLEHRFSALCALMEMGSMGNMQNSNDAPQ